MTPPGNLPTRSASGAQIWLRSPDSPRRRLAAGRVPQSLPLPCARRGDLKLRRRTPRPSGRRDEAGGSVGAGAGDHLRRDPRSAEGAAVRRRGRFLGRPRVLPEARP
jgi:hypothetical protein